MNHPIQYLGEVDVRTRLLQAAETLLDASADRDISTRAVCDAAGVGAPMLYRLFGDKDGLLSAVVDYGFEQYLSTKKAAPESANPVVDLRNGWDTHVAFARSRSAVYRLMYSPGFAEIPHAAADALALLEQVLQRCASCGMLQLDVRPAAQAIMAANVGVALSIITQPLTYDDPDLSRRTRDAVHRSVLTPEAMRTGRSPDDGSLGDAVRGPTSRTAIQLRALLELEQHGLTGAEAHLMREWLARLASSDEQC